MRVKLMPKYLPVYEHEWSYLPDKIRICTEEGHVVDYIPEGRPQKSVLAGLLDKFNNTVFGGNEKKRSTEDK